MQYRFFALISRMRFIGRWGLMRNSYEENVQEHSHMVAVLAHGLAVIQRDVLHEPADPDRCASAALFHDASEILTGDLPTPIKYDNPEIRRAYKAIEAVSCEKLLAFLPSELRPAYRPLLMEQDPDVARIVKAADKLSAYIKMRRGTEGRQRRVPPRRRADARGPRRHEAAVSRLLFGALHAEL
jgi:5'-deoxynucleotidase